jgi:hypothetical protein
LLLLDAVGTLLTAGAIVPATLGAGAGVLTWGDSAAWAVGELPRAATDNNAVQKWTEGLGKRRLNILPHCNWLGAEAATISTLTLSWAAW